VSTSVPPDPDPGAKVGKGSRLLARADALHEYLSGVLCVASDFTARTWQHSPQEELPASSVAHRQPVPSWRSSQGIHTHFFGAVVAFDKP